MNFQQIIENVKKEFNGESSHAQNVEFESNGRKYVVSDNGYSFNVYRRDSSGDFIAQRTGKSMAVIRKFAA